MDFKEVKDSGERTSYGSGAKRDRRKGKGAYHLLPPRAIRRVAIHFENGAEKYGERNWELGMPMSDFLQSALRHCFNVLEGKTDEDHLSAAVFNLLAMIEQQEKFELGLLDPSLDDLPKEPNA